MSTGCDNNYLENLTSIYLYRTLDVFGILKSLNVKCMCKETD
jgi:hypothetical protein